MSSLLPPAFHLVPLDREVDAFERALRAAPRGADHGTLFWTRRADRLEMAVVCEPELPSGRALESLYVLTIAAGEVLRETLPAALPIAYAWPGDLILAGARTGRSRMALAPTADPTGVPPWLVLGLEIALGRSLLDPAPLLTRIAERFLAWQQRWLEQGLEPVRAAWNARCHQRGEPGALVLAGRRITGTIDGLDAQGALRVGEHRLALGDVLDRLA